MGKGRNSENQFANELTRLTTDDVDAISVGYSGGAAEEVSDIRIDVNPKVVSSSDDSLPSKTRYDLELKSRSVDSGKRTSINGSRHADDENGLKELKRLISVPVWSRPLLCLDLTNREMAVFDAIDLHEHLTTDGSVPNEYFNARLTPSDNISFEKPSTDEWPSAQSGDDPAVVVARELNLPLADE